MVIDSSQARPSAGRADRARYLTASGFGVWGAQLGQIAIPLTAVQVIGVGTGGVAVLATTLTVPFMVLGLPVGAWLDRVRRRPVMITADLVRAVALVTVPLAASFGALTFGHLWAVVLVVGVATVFFDLATQSHLKDLVSSDALIRMNGRLATIVQTALICAPPLGGWLAGWWGAPLVLSLTAIGYALSALWLWQIHVGENRPTRAVENRRLLRDIGEGLVFVARHPVLRAVLGAGMLVNVATAGVAATMPVLALRDLGWSEGDLGMFFGVGGLGGLAGALVAPYLVRWLGAGRSVLGIGIAIAPVALLLPMIEAPVPGPVVAGAWAMVIFKIGFDAVTMMSFRQRVTPTELMGRVNGSMRVCFSGAVAVGGAMAGLIATSFGERATLLVVAAALACVWIPIAVSPLRRMTTLED